MSETTRLPHRERAMLALPASVLTAWPMDMDALLARLFCPLVLAR